MGHRRTLISIVIVAAMISGLAGVKAKSSEAAVPQTSWAHLSAAQAVREGNRRLLDGMPASALEAYRHARKLEPDAREIDFSQGLALFELGRYEEAREAFENAVTSSSESLVDDAIYCVGTTYHAQALRVAGNLQEAIALIETAMQRYRTVLAHQPDHEAAGDANHKAARMWRSLKEQWRQQQQRQHGRRDDDVDTGIGQESPQQRHNATEWQGRPPQGRPRQAESPQADESRHRQNERRRQVRQDRQGQVPRDQAERNLREMMQALRARKKQRHTRIQPVDAVPVEKDW